VWDVLGGRQWAGTTSPVSPVEALSLSYDGRVLMAGYKAGTARVRDVRTGSLIGRVLNHSGRIRAVALSADGRLAATDGDDRTIRLWDTATGVPIGPGYSTAGAANAIAFSPDGRLILAGEGDDSARFWDVAPAAVEGEERLAQRASLMTNLAFDPSGNLVPLAPEQWDRLRQALPDQIARDGEAVLGNPAGPAARPPGEDSGRPSP
jgi:WD40 repeat protein